MKRNRKIRTIPISAVTVVNPRDRRQAPFKELVTSIARVGLKRPITVSDRKGSENFELVCGGGRIEAFSALKAKEIPAIVTDLSTEDCILSSLVENIARRRHSPVELVSDIERLARSYDTAEIAAKLGVPQAYVNTVRHLLKNGEEGLIKALERKAITPSLALEIAKAETPQLQEALLRLYADGKHTINEVAKMRKLFAARRRAQSRITEQEITPAALVRVYRQEIDRQTLVARKADLTHMRLTFIMTALKTLLAQRMFVKLLRDEELERIPLPLLRRLSAQQDVAT